MNDSEEAVIGNCNKVTYAVVPSLSTLSLVMMWNIERVLIGLMGLTGGFSSKIHNVPTGFF